MTSKVAKLILEDGTEFKGKIFGAATSVAGEVVFNTGMVGYPETLSDPSYKGQILVLTYPLVGNYGVPDMKLDEYGLPEVFESDKIQIAGLIVSEYSATHSHYDAAKSLGTWMKDADVIGLQGIDTRELTRKLRDKGTMLGKIEVGDDKLEYVDPMAQDLVSKVTVKEVSTVGKPIKGAPTVVLLDCGCKTNIARSLVKRGVNVVRVPYEHYFLDMEYDGVLLSNGPGDPQTYRQTVKHVEHAIAVGKPILGICLGHQALALAAGADTYKLKFGHRGQNQPCVEFKRDENGAVYRSKRCFISSQNHGYAVKADTLEGDWQIWFENANDNTVEGIRHKTKPFWGVQFHPEAKPGPVDTAWIFDKFVDAVKRGAK